MTPASLRQRLTRALAGAFLLAGCAAPTDDTAGPTLFLVGDSTMADQPAEAYPEQGWGQALPAFLTAELALENHARNGRSTRSFIDEGRWGAVLERLRPGDFVVIGFGHNDQKSEDPSRYAAPWRAYRENLEAMVDQVIARAARPILVTSIYRRQFDEEGLPRPSLGEYPEVTRAVAAERQVPLIDLNAGTRQLLIDEGPLGSADLYMQIEPGAYPNLPEGRDDNTHLQARGADRVAQLFVEEVIARELPLAGYMRQP